MNKLIYAYYVAGEKHAKQKRKANKEPYINHLLETVYQLSRAGVNDEDTLVSAVLHDSLEDTDLMGWSAPLPNRLQMSHDVST